MAEHEEFLLGITIVAVEADRERSLSQKWTGIRACTIIFSYDTGFFEENLKILDMGALAVLGLEDGVELELDTSLVTEETLKL